MKKKTPEDFGLAVQQHPDSGLQVTARNKQKNIKEIYYEMKLDGSLKETSWITIDEESNIANIDLIKNTILKVNRVYKEDPRIKNAHLWKSVNKEIVKDFVNDFILYNSDVDATNFLELGQRCLLNS